jgi:hypothetical protein
MAAIQFSGRPYENTLTEVAEWHFGRPDPTGQRSPIDAVLIPAKSVKQILPRPTNRVMGGQRSEIDRRAIAAERLEPIFGIPVGKRKQDLCYVAPMVADPVPARAKDTVAQFALKLTE